MVTHDRIKKMTLYLNQGSKTALFEIKEALKKMLYSDNMDAKIIRQSMCVSASVYIDLRLYGALTGSFSDFYYKQVNLGTIRARDSFCMDLDKIVKTYGFKRSRRTLFEDCEKLGVFDLPEHGTIRVKKGSGGHTFNWYVCKGGVYASDVGSFKNHGKELNTIVNQDNFIYFEYLRKG